MGLLLVGIYLIAVGYQGQAGNLILLLSQEGPFLPWAMASGILAWIWRATPPPGRETVHLIIGSAVLGIILLQAAKIIAGVEAAWSNLSSFGSGGATIANIAIGTPQISTTDGTVLAPGDVTTSGASPAAGSLDYNTINALAMQAGFTGQSATNISAIVLAESGGNPNAVNTNYATDPGGSYGLAQINAASHPNDFGVPGAVYDPLTNLKMAYQISNGGTNFSPWSTFKNGAYKKFLPAS